MEINIRRPRRNRKSEAIRSIVRENEVRLNDLLFPLFLIDGTNKKIAVESRCNKKANSISCSQPDSQQQRQ